MLDGKRCEEEYMVVSTSTSSREAVGGCEHGFYSLITEDSM